MGGVEGLKDRIAREFGTPAAVRPRDGILTSCNILGERKLDRTGALLSGGKIPAALT